MNKKISQTLESLLKDPEATNEDFIYGTSAYCPLAWSHFHVATNGDVRPCCIGDSKIPLGNINNQTYDEIWNGDKMKKFRLDMLADKKSPMCTECYKKEATGEWSQRVDAIKKFQKTSSEWVLETEEDGTSTTSKPIYWDIRFNNICNMRCRMCGHFSSSKWFKDAKELEKRHGDRSHLQGDQDQKAILYGVEDGAALLDRLEEYIPFVEEIYFAGGEPLQMEEHYRILKMLDKHERYDLRIRYSTNLLSLKYKNEDLVQLWKKFQWIECVASVDASGARGEILRKDTDWQQILDNAHRIQREAPNVWFRIAPTVQILSIYTLPDLHKEFLREGLIRANDVFYNILTSPQHHNIQNLPQNMKDEIVEIWHDYKNWLLESYPNERKHDVLMTIEHVIGHMLAVKGDPDLMYKLVERTQQLDDLRGEDTPSTFPELKYIWDNYK